MIPGQPTRGSILLVDDEPLMRETLAELLQAVGYQVACAADGMDALGYLRSRPAPDLILCDLEMPRMNGRLFRLQQQQDLTLAAIPFVIYGPPAGLAGIAHQLNAVGCLEKPIDPEDLFTVINRYCSPLVGPNPLAQLRDVGTVP